jgi:hypothetical protein
VILIAVKVLLAPGFVLLASLMGRRFGPRVAGLIGGLPVVAGPILFVYALEHGQRFAGNAANGTLLGLVSLTAFVVVYGHLAGRYSWPVSLLGGWSAFLALTTAFSFVTISPPLALALVALVLVIAPSLLPAGEASGSTLRMPSWDLPLRAACSIVLVLALTGAASWLGSRVSGLLAPFPVIGSVLVAFAHAQRGRNETLRLLRGLLLGYGGFALFAFTLAELLHPHGIALSFTVAACLAVMCQGALLLAGVVGSRLRARLAAESRV